VQEGIKRDRGLNFHLNRGADLVRKTVGKWIPEDLQNGGDGVIVRYGLKKGTCEVVGNDDLNANVPGTLTDDAIEEAVKSATPKALGIKQGQLRSDSSFMDLGADSLDITEIATDVAKATGVDVTPQTLFRQPSVASLTSHLSRTLLNASLGSSAKGRHSRANSLLSLSPQRRGRSRANSIQENISVQRSSFRQSALCGSFCSDVLSQFKPDIAIVGMSCRFPGDVSCPGEYWKLMEDGVSTSSTIPFERWEVHSRAKHLNLCEKETSQVLFGSFVDDIEYFDPSVFNISKSEATTMSPLQRSVLETSYLALLDAGYSAKNMTGLDCGVFVGNWVDSNTGVRRESTSDSSVYRFTGLSTSITSGRISYLFDLKGPNIVYDTACSSSLVALDAAMSALNDGKCAMALVVGANELFDSSVFESCAKAGMLSPTGRCRTFDASADGYLRGEGSGALVLMPARKAKPGLIYVNVLGTSVMSDGASASITAPNGAAQETLINRALDASGLSPRDVDYVEAHGTGTALVTPSRWRHWLKCLPSPEVNPTL